MIVVSNTSPLIALARVGLVSILNDLYHDLHITQAIYDEVVRHGQGLPGSAEIEAAADDWIHVHPTPSRETLKKYQRDRLTLNDASVIALGISQAADLVIVDEQELRQAARAQNLPIVGTGGILVRAKDAGLITRVTDYLEQMQEDDFYLSEDVVHRTRQLAGEAEEDSNDD